MLTVIESQMKYPLRLRSASEKSTSGSNLPRHLILSIVVHSGDMQKAGLFVHILTQDLVKVENMLA